MLDILNYYTYSFIGCAYYWNPLLTKLRARWSTNEFPCSVPNRYCVEVSTTFPVTI